MPIAVGKRLRCDVCGAEIIVTRSGEGPVMCHDQEMTAK